LGREEKEEKKEEALILDYGRKGREGGGKAHSAGAVREGTEKKKKEKKRSDFRRKRGKSWN